MPRELRAVLPLAAVLLLAPAPGAAKPGVNQLLKQLRQTQGDAQLRVIRALGRTGKGKAGAALLPLLDVRKDSPRRSAAIVEALGRLEERAAVEPLIGAWDYLVSLRQQMDLTAQIQVLRRAVVEALGGIGGESAGRTLMEALSDPEPSVVEGAVRGLGLMRERQAAEALSELADRGGNVGQAACESLGRIGDAKGVATLQRLAARESPLEAAPAAYGLALMGRKEGLRKLEDILDSSLTGESAALLAAYYLTKLDKRSGLDHLVGLVDAQGGSLRVPAAEALGKSGNQRAVLPLVEALEDAPPPLKLAIVRGLGQLGGPRAVYALKNLQDDTSLTVRNAAGAALAELGED